MRFERFNSAAGITKKLLRIVPIFILIWLVCMPLPRGLHAQSGGHSINLSWSAPASGTTPTGYNVKRSTTAGAEVTIASVPASVTTFSDTTGVAGTQYFYEVTATNAQASPPEGVPSNEVSATFLPLGALGAPGALSAVSK